MIPPVVSRNAHIFILVLHSVLAVDIDDARANLVKEVPIVDEVWDATH